MKILQIDSAQPDPHVIADAVMYLKLGKIIAHPTDTLYGLAAHVGIAAAVQRIFTIKQREVSSPLPVLIGEQDQLLPLVDSVPDAAKLLMKQFWPGPLTIVFPAAETVNPVLIGFGRTIGVRFPDHPISQALCLRAKTPITSTSINLQGQQPAGNPSAIDEKLTVQIDCLLDGGNATQAVSSTLVDVTVTPARVLREGIIPAADIAGCIPVEETEPGT